MIEERNEFAYLDNRTIRRGDLFKVSGGPTYRESRFGVRGTFRFVSAWSQDNRWYVLCDEIDRAAIDHRTGRLCITSAHVLFVSGPDYPHPVLPGITMRPYRIVRMRKETARKRGVQLVEA